MDDGVFCSSLSFVSFSTAMVLISVVVTAREDEEKHGDRNFRESDRRDVFGAGVVVAAATMEALVTTVLVDASISDAGTEDNGTTARFPSDASITNLFTGGWESDGRSTVVSLTVDVTSAVVLVLSMMELVRGGVS